MKSGREQTVLLVEDDPNDTLLFKRAFSKCGSKAQLKTVDSAEQAQAYLSRPGAGLELPRVLLLDLKLPGRSGMELLAWIRSRAALRTLVVVAFTSSREISDVRAAYGAGVNSFIAKPSGFEALLSAVDLICKYWITLNEQPEPRAVDGAAAVQEKG
jgi:CheY-like chemotaxis protein